MIVSIESISNAESEKSVLFPGFKDLYSLHRNDGKSQVDVFPSQQTCARVYSHTMPSESQRICKLFLK